MSKGASTNQVGREAYLFQPNHGGLKLLADPVESASMQLLNDLERIAANPLVSLLAGGLIGILGSMAVAKWYHPGSRKATSSAGATGSQLFVETLTVTTINTFTTSTSADDNEPWAWVAGIGLLALGATAVTIAHPRVVEAVLCGITGLVAVGILRSEKALSTLLSSKTAGRLWTKILAGLYAFSGVVEALALLYWQDHYLPTGRYIKIVVGLGLLLFSLCALFSLFSLVWLRMWDWRTRCEPRWAAARWLIDRISEVGLRPWGGRRRFWLLLLVVGAMVLAAILDSGILLRPA